MTYNKKLQEMHESSKILEISMERIILYLFQIQREKFLYLCFCFENVYKFHDA